MQPGRSSLWLQLLRKYCRQTSDSASFFCWSIRLQGSTVLSRVLTAFLWLGWREIWGMSMCLLCRGTMLTGKRPHGNHVPSTKLVTPRLLWHPWFQSCYLHIGKCSEVGCPFLLILGGRSLATDPGLFEYLSSYFVESQSWTGLAFWEKPLSLALNGPAVWAETYDSWEFRMPRMTWRAWSPVRNK